MSTNGDRIWIEGCISGGDEASVPLFESVRGVDGIENGLHAVMAFDGGSFPYACCTLEFVSLAYAQRTTYSEWERDDRFLNFLVEEAPVPSGPI